MAEALTLKYRPQTFTDLIGQRPVQAILRQMVARNRVPAGLLFEGGSGTGKTTTARILAAALNCESSPADVGGVPCGVCPSDKAIYDGSSLDVIEIDAASNGLVDDIRALRSQVSYSVGGRCRVIILDEAHSMSAAAFDALLKTLEEPPPATVFLLLTTEPGRLPRTVLNRLMPFTFKRLSVADVVGRLSYICVQEGYDVDGAFLLVLAERADGSLRNAIMLLDQAHSADIRTLDAYADVMGYGDYAPQLASALAVGELAAAYDIVDLAVSRTGDPTTVANALAAVYKDILILRAGGTCPRQGEALAERQRLADQLDTVTVVAAMRILWDLKTRMRANEDPRVGIDLAVTLIADVHTKTRPQAPTPVSAPRKLSLNDMKVMHP
jgi:DNA polymerase III subunit gamma/tau